MDKLLKFPIVEGNDQDKLHTSHLIHCKADRLPIEAGIVLHPKLDLCKSK